MKAVLNYVKEHAKHFIIGLVMLVLTFGIYGVYKLYKSNK